LYLDYQGYDFHGSDFHLHDVHKNVLRRKHRHIRGLQVLCGVARGVDFYPHQVKLDRVDAEDSPKDPQDGLD
jgi:hypothetical protein